MMNPCDSSAKYNDRPAEKKNILLLGGTADGRKLAEAINHLDVHLIYSVAGLVRLPSVGCESVVGGFTQFGGLHSYIKNRNISGVIDATHPYAKRMSETACSVTSALNIPYWRFCRLPWQPSEKDNWIDITDETELLKNLAGYNSVFLTAGQISHSLTTDLGAMGHQQQLLRTAVEPSMQLPDSMTWLKAIGPFSVEGEQAIFKKFNIDVLVSKNSGGHSTSAKLTVAREKAIPVLMIQRPFISPAAFEFTSRTELVGAVMNYLKP